MLISDSVEGTTNETYQTFNPIYDPDTQRTVYVYRDKDQSYYPVSIVVKASGTGIDTIGTPVFFASENMASRFNLGFYDPDTDRVVVTWTKGTGTESLRYAVGTVTGGTTNSTSWGTAGDAGDNTYVPSYNLSYDTAASRALLVKVRGAGNNADPRDLRYFVGTVTGGTTNSINWGSQKTVRSDNGVNAGYRMRAQAYCPNINRHAIFYFDYHSTDTVVGIVGTLTGGTTNSVS